MQLTNTILQPRFFPFQSIHESPKITTTIIQYLPITFHQKFRNKRKRKKKKISRNTRQQFQPTCTSLKSIRKLAPARGRDGGGCDYAARRVSASSRIGDHLESCRKVYTRERFRIARGEFHTKRKALHRNADTVA